MNFLNNVSKVSNMEKSKNKETPEQPTAEELGDAFKAAEAIQNDLLHYGENAAVIDQEFERSNENRSLSLTSSTLPERKCLIPLETDFKAQTTKRA